jgi:hypothetical protein
MVTRSDALTMDLQRHYPGNYPNQSTFGALLSLHAAGVQAFQLQIQHFSWKFSAVAAPFAQTPSTDLPTRVDALWPHVCIVATMASMLNYYGLSLDTVENCSAMYSTDGTIPPLPGERTLDGAAYLFQQDGVLAAGPDPVTPIQTQAVASVRCIYATVTTPPVGAAIILNVKQSNDNGLTWTTLQTLTIPDGGVTSANVAAEGIPTSRRAPYEEGWPLPSLWPTPTLSGDDWIGYDILQTGASVPGAGLRVYIQT